MDLYFSQCILFLCVWQCSETNTPAGGWKPWGVRRRACPQVLGRKPPPPATLRRPPLDKLQRHPVHFPSGLQAPSSPLMSQTWGDLAWRLRSGARGRAEAPLE